MPRGLAPGFGLGSRLPPSSCPSSLPEAGAAGAAGAGAAASPRCCLRSQRRRRSCKRGRYPGGIGLGLPSPGAGLLLPPCCSWELGKTAGARRATGRCVCVRERRNAAATAGGALVGREAQHCLPRDPGDARDLPAGNSPHWAARGGQGWDKEQFGMGMAAGDSGPLPLGFQPPCCRRAWAGSSSTLQSSRIGERRPWGCLFCFVLCFLSG